MAYVTGSAANISDLAAALRNACIANGWANPAGNILSKGTSFFSVAASGNFVELKGGLGQSSGTLTTASPNFVRLGGSYMTFPATYEIHILTNPDEVYCIINYNSDFYQQLSFGKSDVPGIGGTGAWFSGAKGSTQSLTGAYANKVFLSVSWPESVATTTYDGFGCGLFLDSSVGGGIYFSSFVHTGLDSTPWRSGYSGTAALTGCRGGGSQVGSLLQQLPNLYNSANVLLPIKPVALRSSGGVTIIANPKNARYLRIDNVVPGEIITFGADKWKVYPFYRKDATVRNGVDWPTGATHSGTFGYAIRYTGT